MLFYLKLCRWTPDAVVFDSHQRYGTLSYWIQHLFSTSSGATLLYSTLEIVASTIEYRNPVDKNKYLRIKVLNFDNDPHDFRFSISFIFRTLSILFSTLGIFFFNIYMVIVNASPNHQ